MSYVVLIVVESLSWKSPAYIISRGGARLQHTLDVLRRLPFSTPKVVWVPINDSRMVAFAPKTQDIRRIHTYSNKLAHLDIWARIAVDSSISANEWGFVFEDDIDLHASISPCEFAASLAKVLVQATQEDSPVIYLGRCHSSEHDRGSPEGGLVRHSAVCHSNVTISHLDRTSLAFPEHDFSSWRGRGSCAHAYGVRKSHAAGLYDFLALRRNITELDSSFVYMDTYFYHALPLTWLVGSSLCEENEPLHCGLLFQNRSRFPSSLR
jgi:hypothetical protein